MFRAECSPVTVPSDPHLLSVSQAETAVKLRLITDVRCQYTLARILYTTAVS